MQISSKDLIFLIGLTSIIFLIAPVALMIYVGLYNKRKRRHQEEKELLAKNFEHELLKSQMEVQEQTLQTIASHLHDNIGQLLSLTVVTLSTIKMSDPERVPDKIESASSLAKRSLQELRQLARLLHGEELISMGLAEAISFELNHIKTAGLHAIAFESNYIPNKGDPKREIILFRIFQEVLNNIIKHAEADQIKVRIEQTAQSLTLTVADNGQGFDVEAVNMYRPGMGLHTISKRVQIIGGSLTIKTGLQSGTEIIIILFYQE